MVYQFTQAQFENISSAVDELQTYAAELRHRDNVSLLNGMIDTAYQLRAALHEGTIVKEQDDE